MTLVPARILHVFGMRRSGNHAVVDWLLRNATERGAVFLNNCGLARDPLEQNAGVDVYVDGQKIDFKKKVTQVDRLEVAGPNPLVLASYEDKLPGQITARTPLAQADGTIIIYRSFLNWAASLYQKVSTKVGNGPIWTLHVMMRSCHVYGQLLQRLGEASCTILYDRWFADDTYRGELLGKLGFAKRDNTLGKMQRYGGGSSFDDKNTAPQDLDIMTRVDRLADVPGFNLFLSAVASDTDYLNLLEPHFPDDTARLRSLAARHDLPAGGMA